MKSGKNALAAVGLAAALMAAAPAGAYAVTGTITGDDGNPVALTAGAPLTLRNMSIRAVGMVGPAEAGSFKTTVLDPAGVSAGSSLDFCWNTQYSNEARHTVNFRGNGTYTLFFTLYTDRDCKKIKSQPTLQWTVAASVGIGQPPSPLLTRQQNSFSTNQHQFDFAGNPGASSYEIKFARGGIVQPDGSISSPALQTTTVSSQTGKVSFFSSEPGDYVMVARAKGGDYGTPWSPPIRFRMIAPFDFSSRTFPDRRGPTFRVRGVLRQTNAGGRVTIAAARGSKGKRFRTLGRARVNRSGVFSLRFRLRDGRYRLRYSYRGSTTVARGTIYEVITIRRGLG
jgi:hypothetical protein